MQRALLLDLEVTKRPSVSQLLSSEDKSLLVKWISLLVLDLHLHVFNRLESIYIQSDCFTRRGVYKDLKGLTILNFLIYF